MADEQGMEDMETGLVVHARYYYKKTSLKSPLKPGSGSKMEPIMGGCLSTQPTVKVMAWKAKEIGKVYSKFLSCICLYICAWLVGSYEN